MRRAWLTGAAACAVSVAVAALGACGGADRPSRPRPRVARDATGAPVRLPAEVRRVVPTLPGLTETVIALGARSLLVGVGAADAGLPGFDLEGLPRVPVFPEISAEALASLDPDLVLVDATLSPVDVGPLRRRFEGVFVADSRTLDGLRTTFERLGEALSREAEASRLVADLDRARREARAEGSPGVLLLAQSEPPHALGPGALLDDVLRAVGARNALADLGAPSKEVSWERVIEAAPAWIVLTGPEAAMSPALLARLSVVPAVASGRIALAPDDLQRAGPRLARAMERLAKVLSGTLPPAALSRQEPLAEPGR